MIQHCLLLSLLAITSCTVMETRQYNLTDAPVTWRGVSEVIDEEIVQYSVKFRNIGSQIVSFDYTLVDDSSVPHVDAAGPNSGLVENLYPGAEIEVKNTWKHEDVTVQLGRVTYGKRTTEQLAKVYKPWQTTPAATSTGAGGLLPLPEPPVTPPAPAAGE